MMIPSIINIFLTDDFSKAIEVPINPNTTINDVIKYCKGSQEGTYQLFELWNETKRNINKTERPYALLQQWGTRAPYIKFLLQSLPFSDNSAFREKVNISGMDFIISSGRLLLTNGKEVSLNDLKEIAKKQQHQIHLQEKIMIEKEQKLRDLKQFLHQNKLEAIENDKCYQLRVTAQAQEEKLCRIQAMKEKLNQQENENSSLSHQRDMMRDALEKKQKELSFALGKVQELTNQLDELRRMRDTSFVNTASLTNLELDRLMKEAASLNKLRDEHFFNLKDRRDYLNKCNADLSDLNRQIEDLNNQLEQKKREAIAGTNESSVATNSKTGSLPRMHTIVAAVEPLVKQADPTMTRPPSKTSSDSGPALSPPLAALPSRNDGSTVRTLLKNQPQRLAQHFARQRPHSPYFSIPASTFKAQNNKDFYNKSMPPSVNKEARPESAMSRLYSEFAQTSQQDALTAKVRPLVTQSSLTLLPTHHQRVPSPSYYHLSTKSQSVDTPIPRTPSERSLFTQMQPSSVQTKQTKVESQQSTNSLSTSSFYTHLPPPYPTSNAAEPSTENSVNEEFKDSLPVERSSTVDIEALRRKFAHAPRPLKKRNSFTEPERVQGPNIPKSLYEKFYKKADIPFYRPIAEESYRSTPPPPYEDPNHLVTSPNNVNSVDQTKSEDNFAKAVSYEKNLTPKEFLKQQNLSASKFKPPRIGISSAQQSFDSDKSKLVNSASCSSTNSLQAPTLKAVPPKGILKRPRTPGKQPGRRIRFDPFALLLDASLEGDFNMVSRIITQVPNPSQPNDEGITALHNAVCACHFELVRFLVHYGSDVNAADTDGWTPLHCSASCNNYQMSRFLVENGACVFATTLSDGETAADKCEEMDDGFMQCYEYLSGIQEKLGVVRQGQVYALYDYIAQINDELSFQDGDLMTIVRRGDDSEREWWWARIGNQEGYIPRNLIGMWPRIKSNREGKE